MALSDDQKAILRLLSQRGEQGYEDLSALMGVGVAEVHRRAKQAAAELEAEGIPAPAIPQPPGGAGGEPTPATAPQEPQEPAPEIVHSSAAPRAKPSPTPPAAKPSGHHRTLKEDMHRLKLLENRGLWAIVAGALVVVLFAVSIFTGGEGDGGDDTTNPTTTSSAAQGKTVAALEAASESSKKEVTKASLAAVDDSDAVGVAIFGRVKDSLALQVAAEGLDPAEEGQSYTIWLAASEEKMLPLASTEVGEDGQIAAQLEVPAEVLEYLATETFGEIAVTKTDDAELKASLRKATKAKEAPAYTGDPVLRGEITGPIIGAAFRLEEKDR